MNKVTFELKNPNANKHTAIILRFSAADGRLNYYTGESIHPHKWNNSKTLDKGTRAILRRIVTAMEEMDVDCKVKGVRMTCGLIRGRLDALLNKQVSHAGITVYPSFAEAVTGMQAGTILTPKNEKYSASTVRGIEHHITILQAFCPGMRFNEIDLPMYQAFITWCHAKDFSRNYTGTLIKNWKTLLRVTRGKHHDNNVYESKEFKRLQEDTTDIYLTDAEIKRLNRPKITARQEVARDWFILGCYLGLRVSDLVQLDAKNLHKGFITVVNEKTDTKVVIPVHPVAASILKRWKGFPPAITDVELNRVIKEVAKAAELTDPVVYSVTKGGRRQDFRLEKWQMVSSHTMRRSAITNLLKAGVPDAIVMKLVGMKSYGTLKKYNRMSAEDAGQIAAGLAYFNIKR